MSQKELEQVEGQEPSTTTEEVVQPFFYQPTPEEQVSYITSVKIQGQGWLVNGNMSVPNADANTHCQRVKLWISLGNEPEAEFNAEELEAQRLSELKTAKAQALTNTVVTVEDKQFDGNETARLNMVSAIQASELLGLTENSWKLADNTVAVVTVDELKQALALAIQEVGRIVMVESIEEL